MLFIGGSEWAFDKEELRRRGLFLPLAALVFVICCSSMIFRIPGEIYICLKRRWLQARFLMSQEQAKDSLPLRKFSFSMICLPGWYGGLNGFASALQA